MFNFYKLGNWYRNFKNFFYMTWKLRKELSLARPWDYTGLFYLMKGQLSLMEESHRKFSYHINKDVVVKEIKMCIHLLDRIINDNYEKIDYEWFKYNENTGTFNIKRVYLYDLPRGKRFTLRQPEKLKRQDLELLCKIIKRKSFTWWN